MSTRHTNPSTSEDLPFTDISHEEYREYDLENGETYRIENPVALFVRESGSHRILAEGDGQKYVSHYIDPEGKRPIRWVVEPGAPFFLGWGKSAAENTSAPEVQPGKFYSGPERVATTGRSSTEGFEVSCNLSTLDFSAKSSSEKDSSEKDSSEKNFPLKDSPLKDSIEKDPMHTERMGLTVFCPNEVEGGTYRKEDLPDKLYALIESMGAGVIIETDESGFVVSFTAEATE